MLMACGAACHEVRLAGNLDLCDAVVIPGGESTTIGQLLRTSGLWEPLVERLHEGMPLFGTCAGMILAAHKIAQRGPNDREPFGICDIVARRNAFGRQVDSFESDVEIKGLSGGPFHAVFIRAPAIDSWGSDVDILAWHDSKAVMARQGSVLVCAFHPELTSDFRVHELFVSIVREYVSRSEGASA